MFDLHTDWTRFQHEGVNFAFALAVDDTQEKPWTREDGHGPVRELDNTRDKRPGERLLGRAGLNGWGWAYDWAEAVKIARRDRWGANGEGVEALKAKGLTAKAVAALAVGEDFERLDNFMRERWCYVGVVVAFCDDDGAPMIGRDDETESLWAIESDCEDYHAEVARELADNLLANLTAKAS